MKKYILASVIMLDEFIYMYKYYSLITISKLYTLINKFNNWK